MYVHHETTRLIAAQRIQEMHGEAHIDRQLVQARSARKFGRAWKAWLHWQSRRVTAGRPAIRYRAPRSA